jgi:aryl-alcohol dehydrogenase-like predicted oxidoreductase
MKTSTLGRSDLRLSAIGLGCMGMSFGYGPSDQDEARATLARALELGVTHFDTAEVYGPYDNERLLAEVLRPAYGRITVATKVGFRFDGPGTGAERISGVDGRPEALRAAVHGSLERLGVETIDLLYLHRVDPAVPVEDSVGAMADLVREGKVRALGLSEVSAATLERAHRVHPLAALQSEYSLWCRDVEAEVLPACRRLGIGFVPYSPLGRGFLTGALAAESQLAPDDFRRTIPRLQGEALVRNRELLVPTLKRLADELGATPAQLSLAWLLSRGDDIFPVPGARRRTHLEDNVGSDRVALDTATLQAMEAAVPEQEILQPRYADREMALVDR